MGLPLLFWVDFGSDKETKIGGSAGYESFGRWPESIY
jgi:hypothetical protein